MPRKKVLTKNPRRVPLRHSRYFVYIVECATGAYYTGYTSDIDKRVRLHNSGHGAKYLRGKLPVELVFKKEYRYYKSVLTAEREIKRLSRKQKEKLVTAYQETL